MQEKACALVGGVSLAVAPVCPSLHEEVPVSFNTMTVFQFKYKWGMMSFQGGGRGGAALSAK